MPIPIRTAAPAAKAAGTPTATAAAAPVKFSKPAASAGHRVLLYGPGGIGKTTLCLALPAPAFIDLDESLGRLGADVPTLAVSAWADLLAALDAPGWDGVGTVVVDTATRAEEMCVAHVLRTVQMDGNRGYPTSVEGYGYGKGYSFVFEEFGKLLAALDRHARAGRNVVLVAHDCTTTVPNPGGEDFLRYEPRLQSPSSGKASIRLRCREWADHVLFESFDIAVDKEGKAASSGSRTIYRAGEAFAMSKSRTGTAPVVVGPDHAAVWAEIIR